MTEPKSLEDEDRANLVAYLDGELDARSARELEAKLHRDPKARAEAEALRRTWELLDYLPRPEPSASFSHRTMERVSASQMAKALRAGRKRWRPWAFGLGWAAALVLALAAGYAGVGLLPQRFRPSPNQHVDRELVRDLGVIEHLRLYQHVENIDFLRDLDHPELFGDDNRGL